MWALGNPNVGGTKYFQQKICGKQLEVEACHETYKCELTREHTFTSLLVGPISISSGTPRMMFSLLMLMFLLAWLIQNLLYMHTSCSYGIKP